MTTIQDYLAKKALLQKQIQNASGTIGINKKYSNLFRGRDEKNKTKLDVSEFDKVIEINSSEKIAWVEGMTPFDEFVKETLKYNLMPPVVPQLKSITIGGATTGLGIESSSFKFGLVHESVVEMEILLASGEVVVASAKNEHKDLFFGFPNSYGTLGYVLSLKVRLNEVKKFVKLSHTKYSDASTYFEDLENICLQNKDNETLSFVDGTSSSSKEMVITTGQFVDTAPFVSDYKFMEIYYKTLKNKTEDFLTSEDYIWRWDTDWFWCSEAYGVQNPLIRKLWGKARLNSRTYWKIRKVLLSNPILRPLIKKKNREEIIQDIEIPIENCKLWVEFFNKEIGITPFWICPLISNENLASLYPMKRGKLYVNFGFWSSIFSNKEAGYYNRLIEQKVTELGGKKSLYSESFYTEKEFWELYNKNEYDRLKSKYDPQGKFLNLYQKVVKQR